MQMSVEAVKEKLWKKCGTSVNSMVLQLHDDSGSKIADIGDNMRPLGFYSPMDRSVFMLFWNSQIYNIVHHIRKSCILEI